MVFDSPQCVTLAWSSRVWEFPKDRFVSYDHGDEQWARLLGFGRESDVLETLRVEQAIITAMPVTVDGGVVQSDLEIRATCRGLGLRPGPMA
jgi:hypothetical protein